MANTRVYREGGWGWFIVLSAFLAEFIIIGTLKAFGVLLTAMKEDFDTDLWIIGSISGLHYGVLFVLTPLASAVSRKVGGRYVVTCGGILYGLGLVLSSTTHNSVVLAITLVVIAGSGAACIFVIIRAELAFYFYEKYTLAVFIVFFGAPFAMMLYGPVTQVLLDTYGWRGAMLLIGGVGCNLIWTGLLMKRPTGDYASIPHKDLATDDDDDDDECPNVQSSVQTTTNHLLTNLYHLLASAMGIDVFLNFEFLLLAGTRLCYNIAIGGMYVYMVPNGLSLGLSSTEASFLTTAYGVGSLAGLFISAFALHKVSFHATATLSASVAAIALVLTNFLASFIGQMVNTFVIAAGVYYVVQRTSVMTRHLPFGDDRFVFVLGWQGFLIGLAVSLCDTLSGWVYDVTHSFHGTFSVYSAAMVAMDCVFLRIFSALVSLSGQTKLDNKACRGFFRLNETGPTEGVIPLGEVID